MFTDYLYFFSHGNPFHIFYLFSPNDWWSSHPPPQLGIYSGLIKYIENIFSKIMDFCFAFLYIALYFNVVECILVIGLVPFLSSLL